MRASRAVVSVALVVALGLSGCAAAEKAGGDTRSPSPSTSASSSSGTSASPTDQGRVPLTVEITVTGKKVVPAPRRVEISRGEPLRIVLTVDHDDELHAHGFEVEQKVTAHTPTTVVLTGADPGLYDVELHHPELRILQVLVK